MSFSNSLKGFAPFVAKSLIHMTMGRSSDGTSGINPIKTSRFRWDRQLAARSAGILANRSRFAIRFIVRFGAGDDKARTSISPALSHKPAVSLWGVEMVG
ncbi:hypothetical protein [Neorhizobium sp. NCHU2750]|uniref:hypothetical protein n=1 Tax=Neorhizobium sp. NCHU2750 TaxID=1825976 RepID=UPI0019694682